MEHSAPEVPKWQDGERIEHAFQQVPLDTKWEDARNEPKADTSGIRNMYRGRHGQREFVYGSTT
jgi:hypothetical protein